jgi:uncharacterized protein
MEKLPDCIRFLCEETGVRNMQVEPAFNTGRTGWQEPSARDAGRFIDAFIRSMDVAVKHKRELTFSGARPWLTVCSFCSAGTSALVIRPDGRLVSCYEVTDSRHKLAPIFTIGRIGPEGLELDEMAKSRLAEMNKQRLQSCRNCFCLWHCGGDCAARSYSSDLRAHLKHGRRCRINREISREILARFIEDCGGLWKADVKIEKTHEKRT